MSHVPLLFHDANHIYIILDNILIVMLGYVPAAHIANMKMLPNAPNEAVFAKPILSQSTQRSAMSNDFAFPRIGRSTYLQVDKKQLKQIAIWQFDSVAWSFRQICLIKSKRWATRCAWNMRCRLQIKYFNFQIYEMSNACQNGDWSCKNSISATKVANRT